MAKKGRKEAPRKRRYRPRVSAAYEVVITSSGKDGDRWLLDALAETRRGIEAELSQRAVRRFGPAYAVEVSKGWIGASVHATVLLAVRYPVRAVATGVDELRRFAGEIEVAFAEALDGTTPRAIQVVAEADPLSLPQPPAKPEEPTSWDRIAPILGAVATGVGVLGLVTFVGGAIDWARFHATGLPKEQALSVVPTSDLVVVGARTLVPAVLWGLLACALYAIGSALLGTREQRGLSPAVAGYVEEHRATSRGIFLAITVGVFEILAFALTLEAPSTLQFAVFIFLGGLLVLLTYVVARQTNRFPFLAVTIFLALSIFLSGIAYARARSTPELRAAAVVREHRKAVVGFFISENGSRVYLARLEPEGLERGEINRSSARLIGIDKDEITSIEVGAPTEPAAALHQATTLAEELCELELPLKPNPREEDAARNCWDKPPGVYEYPEPTDPSPER